MNSASASVMQEHGARVPSCRSDRSRITTVGALSSAGVLALSLVTGPSDMGAETESEATTVRLASFAMPFAPSPGSLLEKVVLTTRVPAPVQNDGGVGEVDLSAARLTETSRAELTVSPQEVGTATLAATANPLGLVFNSILTPLLALPVIGPIIGITILFGPLIVLVVLACPPCALINFLSYIPAFFGIYLPVPAIPFAATANLVEEAALMPEPSPSDPVAGAAQETDLSANIEITGGSEKSAFIGAEPKGSTELATAVKLLATETAATGTVSENADEDAVATEASSSEAVDVDESEREVSVEEPVTARSNVRNSLGGVPEDRRQHGGTETATDTESSPRATVEKSPNEDSSDSGI
jgi:hypothetical protein